MRCTQLRAGRQSIGLSSPDVRRAAPDGRAAITLHKTLLTLLVYNGLRIDEALVADVAGYTYSSGHRVLRITRKGNKSATIHVAPVTAAALDNYLDSRREGRTGPLFTSQRTQGSRLLYRTAYDMVSQTAGDAKRPAAELVTPHTMRHTFITEALAAGAPLQDVQDAAGHKTQPPPDATTETDSATTSTRRSPFAARVTRAAADDDTYAGETSRRGL